MRILVIGAGVIGNDYAGGLARAGHEVVLLARGRHLADLQRAGLQLDRWGSGGNMRPDVLITATPPAERVDLTIVALRREQVLAAAQ